ncbi:hypothetical protein T12_16043 [Trichinella patagoniensis]|uniref:Uncharacterized protein n=1 Tax=Trichinella patagoniensis TaxID=990121 RepID=A0A0V0ZXU8_9BILA|nr:hypothetical protein T12_16043 [Trichinella patagoniensis]
MKLAGTLQSNCLLESEERCLIYTSSFLEDACIRAAANEILCEKAVRIRWGVGFGVSVHLLVNWRIIRYDLDEGCFSINLLRWAFNTSALILAIFSVGWLTMNSDVISLQRESSEEQADQMISRRVNLLIRQVVNVETVATIATTVAVAAPPNLISPRFLDFPVDSQNVYGIAQSIAQIT